MMCGICGASTDAIPHEGLHIFSSVIYLIKLVLVKYIGYQLKGNLVDCN